MWYTRTEAQKRFSFFFSSTTLAGAFGGLLAYGIAQMDGVRGYMGWRWVFIIEGVITSVVAIILFPLMSDFPEEVKWLTDEEREFVRAKLARDVGKSAHHAKLGLKEVLDVFKDCKSISQTFGHQHLCMGLQFDREGYYWRFHVFRPHRSSIWLVVQVLSNRMNMSNVSRLCLLRSDYYSVFWL